MTGRDRFDPEATEQALEACAECEPHVREEHQGILFYSWGEDRAPNSAKRFAPPALDFIGRGGRVAVLKDLVLRTVATEDMRRLIDTSLGGPSLAEIEEYRLVAQGMSDLGAYSAVLTNQTHSDDSVLTDFEEYGDDEATERIRRSLADSSLLLRPYLVFGVGIGKDEAGLFMALALVHADVESAQQNVDLLRQRIDVSLRAISQSLAGALRTREARGVGGRWADFVERTEVHAQGRVLLAKLRGPVASLWIELRFENALLAHSQPTVADWQQIESSEGGFVVLLPGIPTRVRTVTNTFFGPVDVHLLGTETDTDTYYVAYSDYPEYVVASPGHTAMLDAVRDALLANMGGGLLAEPTTSIEGYPCRGLHLGSIEFDERDFALRGLLCMVQNRQYQIIWLGLGEDAFADRVQEFLDSFRLSGAQSALSSTPAEGTQIASPPPQPETGRVSTPLARSS